MFHRTILRQRGITVSAHQVWLVGLLIRLFLLFLGVTMAFSLFWQ
ncbi:hypothetical protein [Streptomyces sp. ISL-100]|nr:hypothetical protein [Streptomyces sp. ISL-100]